VVDAGPDVPAYASAYPDMRLRSIALASLLLAASIPALAQREKEPKRPKLPAQADTNDARAYYDFALDQLGRDDDLAADALYWSTRLEPRWADPYYARRVAMLMSDPRRLVQYWSGDRRTIQSDGIRRIDSLFYRALTINPFLSQRLERRLFDAVLEEITSRYERAGAGSAGEIRYYIEREMNNWPAADRAWLAYGEGRYDDALRLFAEAVKSDKRNGPLRVDRARVFVNMNQPDSALVELMAAIEDLRKRDKKDLIYVYQSKALTEHSIGLVESRLGHTAAAKDAFGRALQEDLSYFPAHVELAMISLEAKDTTGALSEMDLAVQLRPDDPGALYLYGFTLAATGKYADAEPHLRKAIELDGVYAAPHFALGVALEGAGKKTDAVAEYRAFLSHAARSDLRRTEAEEHLKALGAGM
jgi:tetratricopeptide (TPR) repeat protein